MAAVLDTGALLEVIWVSLVAGVGVTAIFSLALFGGARSAELRRRGSSGPAAVVGAFGVIAGLAFLAGVVFAVRLLITG